MLKKSLVLISILYSSLNASAVDKRFSYQDYLDFGANKGKFKAGATGLSVTSKDGKITVDSFAPMPMIDFGASNKTGVMKGEYSNIGANKVLTAAHMISEVIKDSHGNPYLVRQGTILEFGGVGSRVVSASNDFADYFGQDTPCQGKKCHRTDIEDFAALRMSKVNLNHKAELSPVKVYDENNKDISYENKTSTSGKAEYFNSDRYTLFVRSGTGYQKITENKNDAINIADASKYFTGGLVEISKEDSLKYERAIYTKGYYDDTGRVPFSSVGSEGDSGSALYVWDNQDKKWLMVGFAAATDCAGSSAADGNGQCTYMSYHGINYNTTEAFDKAHSVTSSANLSLDANSLKDGTNELEKTMGALSFKHYYDTKTANQTQANYNDRTKAMEKDKDIYIQGGSLTLSANADLGSSALIIKDNLTYDIKGNFDFLHGGLDIGNNSVVNYYAKTAKNDYLHKVGNGKLNIHSSSPNAGLRIGGGEVELHSTGWQNTFGSIYMTNNSSLKINNASQINTNYLYFGDNAGKFDLNGNSINFNNFYASDNNAVVTNTSTTLSTLNINKFATNESTNTIYHGNIKGNIKITQNHNNKTDKYAVYDGGLDIQDMEFKDGNLAFQGHPVVHNYVDTTTASKIKQSTGEDVFTTPTRLDQQDWEDRLYKMNSLTLNNANLDILKHSSVEIPIINSTSSTITIGKNLAYIDGLDGENIVYVPKSDSMAGSDEYESYHTNMKYQEKVSSGESVAKNIFINSDFDLKTNSKLSLLNGTNYKGKITADDTSSLEFNGAIINANINASSLNSNNTTYIYESTENALNISKSTSGANNTLLIQKDFLNGADKLLLASLANSTIVSENYFDIKGESSVFADLKPNVKYYDENGTAKWYLEKITTPSTPTDPSEPENKPDIPLTPIEPSKPVTPDIPLTPIEPSTPIEKPENKPDIPLIPLEPSTPITPSVPFDPKPENNPSNTETPGHYKEYFFVKEKETAINTAKNTLNQAFFNYVLEWNNMQKRMGELRDEVANGGVWIRNYGGASTYLKDNKTKYYELQIGADKISEFDDFNAYAGIIFTNSIYKLDTKNILEGKVKGIGGGLYSSFLFNNGFYIDMIAKYADYKNDYTLTLNNGNNKAVHIKANNHSKNLVASIELGNRFYMNDYYLEPSVELISGYVSAIKLENKEEHIKLESKSFIPLNTKTMLSFGKQSSEDSRFGFRFGVGLAADLIKSGDKTIRDLNVIRQIEGKKDARMLTNASFNYYFTNNLRLMTEFERTFFGDLNVDYSFNMTLRKSF
ncbi:autotransporter serine protease (peptidase_S8 domain) [Campylobacter sp. RM5004]|uniref:autotransporter outer membrane beta-barrel domain-containing protein n=1 Tax=Campylobacter sp. RM5004 TaxID=1660078 RepID=UPI001EFA6703|nr:S6 family peptidase [Campylobacter sp. RM5004]ULO02373.1 autotransporter serine protease (peptidase_S8 domain) [Campylobacter sp. RM5004]